MERAGFSCFAVLLAAMGCVVYSPTSVHSQVSPTGQLTGRVTVSGARLPTKPHPVFKNRVFCGATVANETLLVSDDGGLRNAVVIMEPLGARPPVAPARIELDNQNCAFVPHVQIAPLGSELLLKNSDPILHTVHARLGTETLFNVGLPKWRRVSKVLSRAGVVRIDCDVLHTWMSAAIVVVATPYFALSDGRGEFSIGALPAGEYRVDIWHEKLGLRSTQVQIQIGVKSVLDVAYRNKELP